MLAQFLLPLILLPTYIIYMITQLQTPIPLETPKGKAWAVAIIDYGPQWDLCWITFVAATGECWTFRNSQIRQGANYTFGIGEPSPINSKHTAHGGHNGKLNGHMAGHAPNGHNGSNGIFLAAQDEDAIMAS